MNHIRIAFRFVQSIQSVQWFRSHSVHFGLFTSHLSIQFVSVHFSPFCSLWSTSVYSVHFNDTLTWVVCVERVSATLTIMFMSHTQHNIVKFLIKLYFIVDTSDGRQVVDIIPLGPKLFLMLLKSYILFPKISDLFIYIYFFLGHLRHIKD